MGRHKEKLETKNKYTEIELCWLADQLHEGKSNADTAEAFRVKFKKPFGVRHLSGVVRRNGGSKTAFIEKNVSEHYKLKIRQAAAQRTKGSSEKKPARIPKTAPAKPKMVSVFVPQPADRPYIKAIEEYMEARFSSESERCCKWTNSDGTSCEEPQDKRGSVYCEEHRKEVHGAPPPEQQEKKTNLRRW